MVGPLKILKDPLTHFLALGGVLFLVFSLLNPSSGVDSDPKTIVVDRAALLTFIQYRSKAFQPERSSAALDAMSADDLQGLIDDYVREEALYREALALGLDANDYIIKRRMIQKVDFITQGFGEAATTTNNEDLEAFYRDNKETYREDGLITFTHVFFDGERRSLDEAKALAEAKLNELSENNEKFSDAPKHGDRFPYGVNHVERTRAHVKSQFGAEMTNALFAKDAEDGLWQGPFLSPYGAHLAMIVMKQPSRVPDLDEIGTRVEADLRRERQREQAALAERTIIDGYTVELDVKGGDGKALADMNQVR